MLIVLSLIVPSLCLWPGGFGEGDGLLVRTGTAGGDEVDTRRIRYHHALTSIFSHPGSPCPSYKRPPFPACTLGLEAGPQNDLLRGSETELLKAVLLP